MKVRLKGFSFNINTRTKVSEKSSPRHLKLEGDLEDFNWSLAQTSILTG